MAIKRKKGSVLEKDELMIAPLIDAVFLLLIFFMLTTVLKNPAVLKMTLPDSLHPQHLDKKQILVELDSEAIIQVDGIPVDFDSFEAYLAQQKHLSGNNTILIRADVLAKHGDVLKLMKMARAQQIETIAIAVNDLSEQVKKR